MDKMTIKRELKNVKRDLEYYMKEYDINQKEAYSIIHANYYIRMTLTKNYVELSEREELYKWVKEGLHNTNTEEK